MAEPGRGGVASRFDSEAPPSIEAPHPLTFGQPQKKYSGELKFRPVDVEWTTDGPGVIAPGKLSAFVRVCTAEFAHAVDVLNLVKLGWTLPNA